ncbi:carotenoid oxygenase family protein [Streptomyces mirabilis]|uniref:carotenoid oxygenase family protein n=1 Tax=Streptomyces mirabilis TaxID=68239 RepID=UPI001E5CD8BD|nr:carotenoid oxygenase family protein [Streptomyces mirabilis]
MTPKGRARAERPTGRAAAVRHEPCDRTDGTSQLLVFAAQEPEAGPVARVRIPVRVPLGLHGCRLPTEE